jgi:hypothetical protein
MPWGSHVYVPALPCNSQLPILQNTLIVSDTAILYLNATGHTCTIGVTDKGKPHYCPTELLTTLLLQAKLHFVRPTARFTKTEKANYYRHARHFCYKSVEHRKGLSGSENMRSTFLGMNT